jgi:hypothetical protein
MEICTPLDGHAKSRGAGQKPPPGPLERHNAVEIYASRSRHVIHVSLRYRVAWLSPTSPTELKGRRQHGISRH